MKYLLSLLCLVCVGCSQPAIETITQTCPKENYVFSRWAQMASTGIVQGATEVQEGLWLGRRCVNCGGIHNPKEVYRGKNGKLFTLKISSASDIKESK